MLVSMLGNDSAHEKYEKLKLEYNVSIKKECLPDEFGENAFKTVDEFVKKTFNLNYECLLYFDYVTGQIILCAIGKSDKVYVNYDNFEFDNFHVASIHNHPSNVFSPPSAKNFNILGRIFEDYELIASKDALWILKAKGNHKNLVNEFKIAANTFFNAIFDNCANRYNDMEMINRMCDVKYGNQLLKYINDKNINGIQLTKTEYVFVKTQPIDQTIEFNCRKWITDPEAIRLARERENDPNILSGKDVIYAFYRMMGMEIDYEDILPEEEDEVILKSILKNRD